MKTSKKTLVRFLWLFTGIGALSFFLVTAPAFAVNQDQFELEGNVANDDGNASTYDWVDMFNVSGGVATPKPNAQLPTNFSAATFTRDFKLHTNGNFDSSDDSTFTTGSKDTLNPGPFNGNPAGWQCTKSNNVQNQVDLINVYAVAFSDPNTSDLIIYFGAERNGNNGTKNIGIWFLQDPAVGCVAGNSGATNFTGSHMDGDIFIVSEFSNGGVVSTINVYEWVGGADGALNPIPVATGADCATAPPGDVVCAVVNAVSFTPPWLTQTDLSGNTQSTAVQQFEFFEGGLNLTQLGLTGCFTKVLFNTRSSDSLTATIFDYAVGDFTLCGLDINKACSSPADVGPNPVIDQTDFDSFITKFDVTISKSGPSGLFDPTLKETATFTTGETCKIIGIFNCASGAPATPILNFQNGTPVQVCDTLGATPITVRIECDTFANGFINSVTAQAATVNNGPKTLTASDTMTQAERCTTQVNPALSVNKICHDTTANHNLSLPAVQASHPLNPKAVDLVYTGSSFTGFGVDVFVQIENTGNIKLENISLSDPEVTSFQPVIITTGNSNHTTTTFNGTLTPGQRAYFTGSYVAAAPDGNQTDPCLAQFTDTVTVTAYDAVSGDQVLPAPVASAVCPLCVCPSSP